jgi:hypothetical protein
MALISNAQLTVILDKLARWASESVGDAEFNDSFTAGMELANSNVMSGAGSLAAYIMATADEDIMADLLPPARDLDEDNPVPPDAFLLGITSVNRMVAALSTHIRRYNGAASLDAYLTVLNAATPTLRAHGFFAKYLKTLSKGNVFIPNDVTLATFAMTGSATGTYTHLTAINTTSYAGAKIVAKNVTALTTDPVVTVIAKKLDGTTASLTATLTTGTINNEANLSDTAKLYTDVTGISIASGGTNAETFSIVAKTDRSIAAA